VKGFDVGINLRLSSNITILNNVLCDNKCGIKLESSSSVVISRNTIVNNSQGILIIQKENNPLSSENIISENVIKNNEDGILLQNSNSNFICRNIIEENRLHGIRLENSSDNAVAENNLNANDFGIVIYGVWPNYELKDRIMKNKVANNKHGICSFQTCNNILKDNQMINNEVDFEVSAHELLYMINDVDTSNTINGKPICYVVNRQNIEVSGDAGYVAIINCSGVVVHHLNLADKQGVWLAYTRNSMVTRNILEHKKYGIYLFRSFNNVISENIIRNNSYGVYFNDAYNNSLLRNIVLNNNIGLYFGGPIPFRLCSNNTIHHNNFINNTKHVDDIHRSEPFSALAINTWDDGSEGNYWSDYKGLDENGDGIGDQPFIIDENNRDNYPLMNPVAFPDLENNNELISWTEPLPIKRIVATAVLMAILLVFVIIYFKKRDNQQAAILENFNNP